MGIHTNSKFNMKGNDGCNYNVNIDIRDNGVAEFTVKDIVTRATVDDGWFVISKNGTLRIERVK